MEISFLGKTSVKLKTKNLTLLANPVSSKEKADVVIYSLKLPRVEIAGPVAREKTFVVDKDGEYELSGVGVISAGSVITFTIDGVIIGYLGDETELSDNQIEKLSEVDVLLVPLKLAGDLISKIEPYIAVLIGYESKEELETFLAENKFETVKRDLDKLKLDQDSLPENTEVVVLNA